MDPNREIIRRHLLEHGTITNIEARDKYNVLHVAEYIRQLRQLGMNIRTEWRCSKVGRRYGVYTLIKEREQLDMFNETPYAQPKASSSGIMLPLLGLLMCMLTACSSDAVGPAPAALELMNKPAGMREKTTVVRPHASADDCSLAGIGDVGRRHVMLRNHPLARTVSVRIEGEGECRWLSPGEIAAFGVAPAGVLHVMDPFTRREIRITSGQGSANGQPSGNGQASGRGRDTVDIDLR